MSELKQFRLPDVGEGLTEADIIRWLVKPGDRVTINQIIVEIETAKAVVELPSPFEGVVAGLLVPEGTTADVGTPIISVDVSPGAGTAAADQGAAAAAGTPALDLIPSPPAEAAVEPGMHGSPAPKQERQAVLVGYGVKLGTTVRRTRKPAAQRSGPAAGAAGAAAAAQQAGTAPASQATQISTGNNGATLAGQPANRERPAVLAKPPVRKLARDTGVDLSALAGTGPNGSITRDDVLAAAGGASAGSDRAGSDRAAGAGAPGPERFAPVTAVSREERIPIRGVRKHTAAAVTVSAFTAPHVTEFLQIDMTETMAAADRLKSLPEFAGVRVSPLLFVAKALLVAAARQPMINSSWDEANQEIVIRHYVNLGIAAATARGLMVPNIKDAQALTLPDLGRALNDLADTARAGKASPADLGGGTITITNVGIFGVDTGTPILTPGEAAILAFGRVRDAPWVHAGQLAVRKVTTLALSFDHRIVDGDIGSAVLGDVGAMLTDPLRMLAWG
jgi:pyruvate dehydrogenase E2 component (dihydrolipoamide acetyltransferase)